jgi:hypothetical protein
MKVRRLPYGEMERNRDAKARFGSRGGGAKVGHDAAAILIRLKWSRPVALTGVTAVLFRAS